MVDSDLIRNTVLSLAIHLTPDELAHVSWLALIKRAKLLKLPQPKKPGVWEWVKRTLLKAWSSWTDYRAFSAAIAQQSARICELEDLLEANRIAVPGGRSDE